MPRKRRKRPPERPPEAELLLSGITDSCPCCLQDARSRDTITCLTCTTKLTNLRTEVARIRSERTRAKQQRAAPDDDLNSVLTLLDMVDSMFNRCYFYTVTAPVTKQYLDELAHWSQVFTSGVGAPMLESTKLVIREAANGATRASIRPRWTDMYIEEQRAKAEQEDHPFEVPSIKALNSSFRAVWRDYGKKPA